MQWLDLSGPLLVFDLIPEKFDIYSPLVSSAPANLKMWKIILSANTFRKRDRRDFPVFSVVSRLAQRAKRYWKLPGMKYAQTQEFLFFLQKNNRNSSEHSHFTSSYQIFKIPALLASFNLQLFEDCKVFYNSICSTNEYNFAAIWFREDCSMPSWVYFNRTVWLLKS